MFVFTTTAEGQDSLFEDQIDVHPLLSRCIEIALSRRDLALDFACLGPDDRPGRGSR